MNKINLKFDIHAVKDMFRDKRVRFGGYAMVVTLAAAAILVVLNLIVQQIPAEVDMTENQLFTLSQQTLEFLEKLDRDVVVYGLYRPGGENQNVIDVLRKYERANRRIRLEFVDPDRNPVFLQKYDKEGTGLSAGSLIFESGGLFKVIPSWDLYDVSYSQTGQARVMGFRAEQRFTNALLYVSSGVTPKIYEITGHGEYSLIQLGLLTTVERENFAVESLNLMTNPSVPEDADVITLLSPDFDLTETEAEALRVYLEDRNGSAVIFLDFNGVEMPNIQGLLRSFGVEVGMAIVMEGDRNHLYTTENPLFMAPIVEAHQITNPLRSDNLTVLMPNNMPVNILEVRKRNIEIEPLLVTSRNSWARTDLNDVSFFRQPGDAAGPINLAVAISRRKSEMSEPEGYRLIVAGNARFIGHIPPFGTLKPNVDFFMNSLSWLNKRTESISVRSKSLFTFPLRISGTLQLAYAGILVILLPVGILVTGLIIWLRRRHL